MARAGSAPSCQAVYSDSRALCGHQRIRGRARRHLCARAGGDSGRNLVCGARVLEVQKEVGQGESGLVGGSAVFDFVACSCGGGLCVLNTDCRLCDDVGGRSVGWRDTLEITG